MNISKKSSLQAALAYIPLELGARAFKISYIIGSKYAFFSGSQIIAPLVGTGKSILAIFISFAVRAVLMYCASHTLIFSLVYHIPTFCASLYLARPTSFITRALALSCIAFFSIHPVGTHVSWYACFWLIPVITSFFRYNYFFAHALGATFLAHGIGTNIFLYTHALNPLFFIELVPYVLIERLCFASGMTLVYKLVQKVYILAPQLLSAYAGSVPGASYEKYSN